MVLRLNNNLGTKELAVRGYMCVVWVVCVVQVWGMWGLYGMCGTWGARVCGICGMCVYGGCVLCGVW